MARDWIAEYHFGRRSIEEMLAGDRKELTPIAYPRDEEPWLKQENEPARWYERFLIYRDLGYKRSIADTVREICRQNGKSDQYPADSTLKSCYKASKFYHWSSRASAWDAYLDKITREEQIQIRRTIVHKQHQMVERLTNLTLERLNSMTPDELKDPIDIIRAFEAAVKTGSLVVGLPTERVESSNMTFTINLGEKDLRKHDRDDDDENIIDV